MKDITIKEKIWRDLESKPDYKNPRTYSDLEDEIILAFYGIKTKYDISAVLEKYGYKRTSSSIKNRAEQLKGMGRKFKKDENLILKHDRV